MLTFGLCLHLFLVVLNRIYISLRANFSVSYSEQFYMYRRDVSVLVPLSFPFPNRLTEIWAWICIHIYCYMWNIIIKPLKLGYAWVGKYLAQLCKNVITYPWHRLIYWQANLLPNLLVPEVHVLMITGISPYENCTSDLYSHRRIHALRTFKG